MSIPDDRPFFLVGSGRVASALARALSQAGLTVAAVGGRNRRAVEEVARLAGATALTIGQLAREWPDRGHLLIAVSDDAIAEVAGALSATNSAAEAVVIHTSGVHAADIVQAACGSNMHPLAFHPVTSLATTRHKPFQGVLATLQGDDEARRFGHWLARRLGGAGIEVDIDQKRAIHAASAMLANMTVVLAAAFDTVVEDAEVDRAAARALRQQLLESVVFNLHHQSPQAALTGPIARGDAGTVRRHLRHLGARDRKLADVYRTLGALALDIVSQKGDLNQEQLNGLERALNRRFG
jgi:predicted short-subunit dehydrogenase-like oxidoreductase (DUF2520 family)